MAPGTTGCDDDDDDDDGDGEDGEVGDGDDDNGYGDSDDGDGDDSEAAGGGGSDGDDGTLAFREHLVPARHALNTSYMFALLVFSATGELGTIILLTLQMRKQR